MYKRPDATRLRAYVCKLDGVRPPMYATPHYATIPQASRSRAQRFGLSSPSDRGNPALPGGAHRVQPAMPLMRDRLSQQMPISGEIRARRLTRSRSALGGGASGFPARLRMTCCSRKTLVATGKSASLPDLSTLNRAFPTPLCLPAGVYPVPKVALIVAACVARSRLRRLTLATLDRCNTTAAQIEATLGCALLQRRPKRGRSAPPRCRR